MQHRVAPRHSLMLCCLLSSLSILPAMAQERPRGENDRGTEARRRPERDVRERGDERSESRSRQDRGRSVNPHESRENHLRAAIRHLRAAGLGDEAQRLERSLQERRGQDTQRTRGRGPSNRERDQRRPNPSHDRVEETVRHLQQAMEQLNQRVRSTEQLQRAVDLAHQQLDELREKAAPHTEELERHFGHQIEGLERSTNHRLEEFERDLVGAMERMELELVRRLEEFERDAAERWHHLHEHEEHEHEEHEHEEHEEEEHEEEEHEKED